MPPSTPSDTPHASGPTLTRWVGATVLWMLATAGPVIWLRRRWELSGDITEDPWYVALFLVVGAVCVALIDRRALVDMRRRRALLAALLLVGALTLSTVWSLDPAYTFTHGLRLVGTLAAGLVLTTRLTAVEQVGSLWIAVHIGCAWSLVDIRRLVPGSQDDRENWVGIFVNRNLLGLVCAVGITVGAMLVWHVVRTWSGRRRVAALVVLTVAAVVDLYLLRGSGSATPIGALLLLAAGLAIVLALRRRAPLGSGAITGLAIAAVSTVAVSAVYLPHLAGFAGRNSDLSRRRPLWDFVLDRIAERPLWGWGYLGPWDDRGFRRELRTYVSKAKDLHTAHNSTLEVALGAGIVVLAVFLVFLVLGTRSSLVSALQPGLWTLWPLVAIAWFLLESLTETFLVADTLPTLLLFVGALAVAPGDDPPEVDGVPPGELAALSHESGTTSRH